MIALESRPGRNLGGWERTIRWGRACQLSAGPGACPDLSLAQVLWSSSSLDGRHLAKRRVTTAGLPSYVSTGL